MDCLVKPFAIVFFGLVVCCWILMEMWRCILIRKLLQTNIPGTIIKFIAHYIKGRKAYTTYINHTSNQRQFKTGVPQGGVLSPTLFNIYTSDLPPPSAPDKVMAYADDTITSTHTNTSAANKYIQPYLHKVLTGQNKTTSY